MTGKAATIEELVSMHVSECGVLGCVTGRSGMGHVESCPSYPTVCRSHVRPGGPVATFFWDVPN